MIKKDIIERITQEAGIRKVKAEKTVTAMMTVIKRELEKGNEVKLQGFGKFSVKKIADRRGRNPNTGELFKIQAHGRVKFTPGKNLKNSLNAGNTVGKKNSDTA